jgi:hypothetical protein
VSNFPECHDSLAQCLRHFSFEVRRSHLRRAIKRGPPWQGEAVACRQGAKWALFHLETRPSGSWRLRECSMSPDTLPPITLILIPAWARRPHSSGWRYGPSGPVGSF